MSKECFREMRKRMFLVFNIICTSVVVYLLHSKRFTAAALYINFNGSRSVVDRPIINLPKYIYIYRFGTMRK